MSRGDKTQVLEDLPAFSRQTQGGIFLAIAGPDRGESVQMRPGRNIYFGSSPECEMTLTDKTVSRRHLMAAWEGEQVVLRDQGSTNGTFVQGSRFKEIAIGFGAEFKLGRTVIKYLPEEEIVDPEPIDQSAFGHLIGGDTKMRQLFKLMQDVAVTEATVLIEGETGTGKELIASGIHYQSRRHDKLFVAQNCAALPENLLESELFGHKKGSFTSADADKKGLFEIADGGTLFLDEVGEMPLSLQAKLLRTLQEGTIRPVGSTSEKQVDVRILCATNRDLAAEVEKGAFRQDLFYRLMVFPIRLPPLRERREDIPLLAEHFLARYVQEYRRHIAGLAQEALDALANYAWPGNIRELENEIQRLVIQAEPGAWIDVSDLSPQIRKVEGTLSRIAPKKGTLKEMMDQVERWLITEALRDNDNNKTRTAQILGITREGLHKKLSKW
jgi:transcriptional regulator with PAS, ATPase and Fis domain